MPDLMTSRPVENESGLPDGVKIDDTTVIKDKMDPTQMSVRFLVSADTPKRAHEFAQDSALMQAGLDLVRKQGLFAPGVTGPAMPVPCNEKGEPSANPMGTIDPNVQQRFYYSITYRYLGED